jgi:uncharacterized membrane protein
MSRYAKRLDRDLARWRAAGWVTADAEASIRRDVASQTRTTELAPVLGILGAVLIGFGAMSFVAAHWTELARGLRLALIFGSLFGCYGLAGFLFERRHPAFANAAILGGVAMFGAGIMLIAQMYHISGHTPDAVLTWALGALLAGVLLKSNPALALAMLLMLLWSGWESSDTNQVHWPFLLGWLAVAAAMLWRGWVPGLHLAAVALAAWTIGLGYLLFHGHGHGVVVGIGLLVAAAGLAAPALFERQHAWGPSVLAYGATVAFAGLFALQFFETTALDHLILLAVFTLGLVLGAIGLGLRSNNATMLWLGYTGFSIEVMALYFKTIGTLLGSSLFFLSAGIIVVLLAVAAYRLHSRGQVAAGTMP